MSRVLFWLGLLLLAGCGQEAPTPGPDRVSIGLPDGFTAEVISADLRGPTQMMVGPDGRLWIAQLAGAESAGNGQVIALDLESGAQEILLQNLNKPTGIAVLAGALWIATEDALLRAPLHADNRPGAPEAVLRDLPNNGRSNGTLTVTPDDKLLYETSGRRRGNAARPGSGTLWQLDPADPTNPTPLATGLKNGYAHVFDANGRLWITEIGDGSVVGAEYEGQPPDELNLVVPGADFGWPQCFGMQEPALNRDGTPARCAQTRTPVALFPPRSTPTGVAVSPWEADVLLVALWLQNRVVRVPVTYDGDNASGTPEPFITNLDNPQHLLVLPDGSLLLSDFGTNTLYKIVNGEW